ncbi:MAG: cysteine--tRNA ligase [Candidatus Terrybacteria bacterium RIFCSPLOWO2_01_FULL_44_24]|uniref:Cysteine--tRNA ligase n=1 Tax=Candidatus Terrybacteria bacterium RIFCSPHIGHO2_01_FULL_43_35 TaxID=1802361 RepID=A0A1G2PFG6_9BACT|nr:MAG: cysteine--tRNA ligase [Candidatus Terrybacteria bacterium RIFCSPHIGHO2_01_FULL_43_35]OHA49966.1 MAG: cysteine--tRNA ligase [Candidatus Terrybacteria bacterium RIFCSPHIGHO2_02_FULL_43_14]OHA51712.1 MAG: cysteine--tRNA ligase [Candidatus Terrybacteria bacterium RIFCSPLOWO2_01_FULL_44_24]
MKFSFYNTLTRQKEELKPLKPKKIDIFVCGPTVYDLAHIGHGRVFVIFDAVVKTLRHSGYNVRYLQNITDVDDKIIARAELQGKTPKALAHKFEHEYLKDMKALNITSPDNYARASDHIDEILSQIKRLLKKDCAYITPNGVYFSVKNFHDYGKLSHQKLDKMEETERIEHDPDKKHKQDFALWKKAKAGEPFWPSPWGKGRPGWHIEDTAIAEKYFGQQYDMHGGALDLIFPHHECEIAQMETISNKKPYVRMWLHAGFLNVRGEKMSKSLGNIISIRDLLKDYSAQAFRMLIFQAHYRSPIDYDEDLMKQAQAAQERLTDFYNRLKTIKRFGPENDRIKSIIFTSNKNFWEKLEDDFNTPRAIAIIFSLMKTLNPLINNFAISKREAKAAKEFLKNADGIMHILGPKQTSSIPQEVKNLINERELMRKERRWTEADQSRKELAQIGWTIEDTPEGPKPKRIE